jgi:hypothetical protein
MTVKAVYIVAQTRVLDGFWYASAKNKCFLSKKEALSYCKRENDTQLAKINAHLKDAAINADRDNRRLKVVLDKLTDEEKEVLLYDFGVDYADTEYQPVKNLDYELSVIEFKVE